jgi:hypothetical protein
MHKLFGKSEHICKDCEHFKKINTSGLMARRFVQKCECYGITHSESSDWAQKWQACGLFNQPYNGKPVIEVRIYQTSVTLTGHISLDDVDTVPMEFYSYEDNEETPREEVTVLDGKWILM